MTIQDRFTPYEDRRTPAEEIEYLATRILRLRGQRDALRDALRGMLATHTSTPELTNSDGWLEARRRAVALLKSLEDV